MLNRNKKSRNTPKSSVNRLKGSVLFYSAYFARFRPRRLRESVNRQRNFPLAPLAPKIQNPFVVSRKQFTAAAFYLRHPSASIIIHVADFCKLSAQYVFRDCLVFRRVLRRGFFQHMVRLLPACAKLNIGRIFHVGPDVYSRR